MPGAITTKNIRDANGSAITMRVWDESGAGAGPFSFFSVQASPHLEYETVAASQTDQVLGASGASGDYLSHLFVVPATTSPGVVSIKDGAGSAITVFTGGASSVSNLVPFPINLGIDSAAGAWKVTTGASVSVIAVGTFT